MKWHCSMPAEATVVGTQCEPRSKISTLQRELYQRRTQITEEATPQEGHTTTTKRRGAKAKMNHRVIVGNVSAWRALIMEDFTVGIMCTM